MQFAHTDWENQAIKKKQPLSAHCQSTANLAEIAAQKIGLPTLGKLIGIAHDLGKAKSEFQQYLFLPTEEQRHALHGKINHSTAGARYLWENIRQGAANPCWTFCAQTAALCIAAHHSGLPNCLSPYGEDGLSARLYPVKHIAYEESLQTFFAECIPQKELQTCFQPAEQEIEALLKKIQTDCADLKPFSRAFFMGMTVRFLLSCLIDSDRYDAYCFQIGLPPKEENSNEKLWKQFSAQLETSLKEMPQQSPLDALRTEISNTCLSAAKRPIGIYQLYLPTGSGKTLASLRFALHHACIHHLERVFYIVPFTTIIDQNAEVIRNMLHGGDKILEHHASLLLDDEDGNRKFLTERWNAPIILTTMVQFLNTLFSTKTQSARRMHNLAHSVLIFDEIQTIPVKCICLFNLAIMFLSRICGATVVLCTATQPQLENTCIKAPLLLSSPKDLVPDYEERFKQFRRTKIVNLCSQVPFHANTLASFMLSRNVHSLLAILNTKKAARNVYRALRAQIKHSANCRFFFLSTDLCAAHRRQVLQNINESLKEPNCIVYIISTQLIEAGIDLSVECVIRSLAGLDSVAQAAGRCNRHSVDICRNVYIIQMAEAEENLSNLPQIYMAQKSCRRVLDEFDANPAVFDNDLLSPKAIAIYYSYYYSFTAEQMVYPIKKSPDLLDLLSQNAEGCRERRKNGQKIYPLNQAFAAAQENFCVIDDNQSAVLVPFNATAKELFRQLTQETNVQMLSKLLRQAQGYAVNVLKGTYKKLQHANALLELPCGVLLLKDAYYDLEVGVTTKPIE